MIARDSLRFRIKRRFAINQELIVMMSMRQRHLNAPAAIMLPFHRMRAGVPIVEVAHQKNLFGLGSPAKEIDRLGHFLC